MYDGESKYGIEYGYQGDGVSSIKEYTATSASGTKTYGAKVKRYKNGVQEAVYRYDGADRTFNTANDIVNRYAFDYFGRTINATTLDNDESDILGVTAAAYTENSGTSKTNNRMEKDAQTGQNGVNLLVAGGAESHDSFSTPSSYWTRISTDSRCNAVVKSGELVRTGTSALKIWLATNAPEDANGDRRHGMYQSVTLESGKTYTFSGYVNTQQITKFGDGGGLYVAFADSSGNILAAGDKVTSVTNQEIENGWQRVYATYTPTASGKYRVVIMQENAYPYAFFDDLQLEVGSVPSNANLLQNGSFNGSTEWTLGNYSTASGDSLHPGVVSATGSPTAMKRGSQTVPINASATETFLLSGWAWAPSVANTEEKLTDSTAESNTTKRYFGLIAKCTYTDATKEYFYMPFNDDYNGWQYTSCVIAPKKANQSKTIESITVIMAYDCNANTVWFDNISLRQEPCTTYTYDSEGNVTAVNATGNSGADFTYASGTTKLTKSVTEDSGTYTYEYTDSRNDHLVTKIKNDGVSLSITYDAMGNSTATTLSSDSNTSIGSIKTAATYSTDGSQLMTQTDSNGYTTTYTYNAQRQMNSTTDHNNTTVRQTYYASERPQQAFISGVVNALNTYSDGMLTQVTRGGYIPNVSTKQEQTYSMAYDGFGNMTSISVGNRTLASYLYGSNNGNLQSMTYGNGAVVSYAYDNLDRVTHEYWNNTLKYQYFYNAEGNLSKKLDVTTNKAVNYEYDSLGRLIHSYRTTGTTINQKIETLYDTENRVASQSWHFGGVTYSESFTYDADDGALTYVDATYGDIGFSYDALKRVSSQYSTRFGQNYTYRNISSTQTTTQVASVSYVKRTNGTNFEEFSLGFTYDNVGNIEKVNSSVRSELNATYDYDQQGQLTSETNTKGSYTYAYDTYGNIRSVSGAESHSYTYGDTKGWCDLLTAYDGHAINYDAIGNPTNWYNTADWTLTWANGRQLTKIVSDDTTVTYTYDEAGIRNGKVVNGTKYTFYTINGKVARQINNGKTQTFFYDPLGRPTSWIYNNTWYYYVVNPQGDVIGIINSTGTTMAEYAYDAWGNVIYSSGELADANPLRYRGYYYDTETGLYYLGSRYYDPQVKRFVNADELASTAHGFLGYNMYAYCNNNPVFGRDSTGSAVESAWDLFSLGLSIYDVATNPSDPTAWIGLAFDVIDLIPVVTGTGELYRAVKAADNLADAVDDATDAVKTVDNAMDAGGSIVAGGCFVAGTPVKTVIGDIAIENLKPGDNVWAWNEESGEASLKSVKQVFINESDELIHLTINGNKIVTTPEHPFYVAHKGWYSAVDLRAGDILVLVNGEYVTLEKTQHEILEVPISVYNFEVEDYHTYYVGIDGVLVHNMCAQPARGVGGKGWEGDKLWRENVAVVDNGGTIESLNGVIPTQNEAERLIDAAGGRAQRIEEPHDFPNPHVYPHINYYTSKKVKGTIRILMLDR